MRCILQARRIVLMFFRAMVELQTGIRARAEGMGITTKTLTTFSVLLFDSRRSQSGGEFALLAFASGQLLYASTVYGVYLAHYRDVQLLPRKPPALKFVVCHSLAQAMY